MISLPAALIAALLSSSPAPTPVNVIDGKDDRGALVQLGPSLGLSAAEIGRHGIDLGGQQTALLKKVEELTLYLIRQNQALTDQNKQIIDQNKQLTEQNTRLEAQQKEIDALKALITEKKH